MTTLRRAGIGTTSVGMGIALYLIGVFLFALNDALGKWLVADYSVGQLLLLRSVGAAIVLVPMVWHLKVDLFDFGQWRLQVVRILCMAGDTFCFYFATRSMPLADVMTFYMAAPLIITALSVPLLGERVEPFRWGAVIVGFIGVLVITNPTGHLVGPQAGVGAGLGVLAAFMSALMTITIRQLNKTERPVTITEGTNTLVGRDPERIWPEVQKILAGQSKAGRVPALWDGKAAERVADAIEAYFRKN